MNKQTKMLVGVGVVAVAGYFIYQSTQKKSFSNLTAPTGLGGLGGGEASGTCPCTNVMRISHIHDSNGNVRSKTYCMSKPLAGLFESNPKWICNGVAVRG
jgi:hypothetical protein